MQIDLTDEAIADHVDEGPPPGRRQKLRTIFGTGVGNALEWYDWNVYAVFAPFLAAQFFKPTNSLSALLSTLVVFAVGFGMRPIGGILFGWFADRRGRRASLLLSIALASAGSLLIGVAPSYSDIGVSASALLVLARLLQGLAYGGEIAASHAYISEMAPPRRRGLWSSTIYVSGVSAVVIATLLGATLTSVLSDQQMDGWGWRVPFIVGGVLGIITLFLRRTMSETPSYEQALAAEEQDRSRTSFARDLWKNRAAALRVMALAAGGSVFFYTWVTAAPAYAIGVKHLPASAVLWSAVIALTVLVATLPLAGALSDRIGRRPCLLMFTLGGAAVTYPLNRLIQDEVWQLTLSMSIAGILIALGSSILPAYLAELFPTHVRASGIGVAYSIGVALCGGTAPYLQTWLAGSGRGDLFLGYTITLMLVAAAVTLVSPETKGKTLE
ncbi:MFS transporter [Streptomyces sp. NPDC001858]